jgi:predicted amidophosphoribosyltransferase
MQCLKNNWSFRTGSLSIEPSKHVAQTLRKNISQWSVFHGDAVLVPVPRSAPIREGDLWPSYEIAKAMQDLRLGRVSTLLERIERVNPSSRSRSEDRPSPFKHSQTIRLQRNLPPNVKSVILVDDIVTRGHTFMGCAWKIEEAYPDVSIHAFAAVRAVSNPYGFKAFYDPVVESGTITYRSGIGDCLRRP